MKKLNLPVPVLFLLQQLHSAGFEAYIVGGAVRDMLIGTEAIKDWDITTNATPEEIMPLFDESFYDNNFGTVMVAPKHVIEQMARCASYKIEDATPFDDLEVFDITTYRCEGGYTDRRKPDKVEWGQSLKDDVLRRDFTINALALDIDAKSYQVVNVLNDSIQAKVIDYYGGEQDLGNRVIRAVGDANTRFNEDALRMMRAIRIGAKLGFQIEANTLAAIQQNAHLIKHISGERIRDEFLKILASNYPADGVTLLHSSGLLNQILPEMEEARGIPQGGRHIYDVWHHMVESLRECPSKDPIVRLGTLLHDVGKPRTMRKQGPRGVTFYGHEVVGARMIKVVADRLRLSKKQKDKLFILSRWHMFTYNPDMTDAAVRRFIRRVGLENINDMIMLRIGDRKGGGSKATSWRLRELQQRIGENLYEPMGVKDLKINGNDLMQKLDIKPGPVIGKVLNQLFEEVMEDKIKNTPDDLLAHAQKILEMLPVSEK